MIRRKPLVIGLVFLALAVVAAVVRFLPEMHTDHKGSAADIGGPFTLIDQTGKQVTDKDYRGQWMLVFFGFTSCPDICPTGVLSITESLKQLGKDGDKVRPIFITLDPYRDTPELLTSYLGNFSPRWVGLLGNMQQINMVASAYRVYHSRQDMPGSELGYTINHSGYIYLMGPDGKYRAHFRYDDTPAVLAAGIRKAIADE